MVLIITLTDLPTRWDDLGKNDYNLGEDFEM